MNVSVTRGVAIAGIFASATIAGANTVPAQPTFTKDVAPILNDNCVVCHRPGETGPMSLTSFDEVRPWAKAIAKAIQDRKMPPWHADAGIGHFANDRSLSDAERDTILKWIETGTAKGNPSDLPPSPEFPASGWQLGEPDLVVEFKKVDLPAGGPDQFFDLIADPGLTEDRWVSAIEVKTGNPKIAHHVIIWQGDQNSGRGWLGAWAAGMPPMKWGEGRGRMLKAGAPLVADMHYHPTDTAQSDQTKIGLHFADTASIEKEVVNLWIQNASFEIPAGAENYGAKASYTFEQDAYIVSLLPHLHYRGKDFTYTAQYPDGRREKLLKVSDYDFNWQTVYEMEEPLYIPKGTRVECVAHWDNSVNNPDNPDPTKNVTFGNESFNEMMIGFVDYVVKDGIRPIPPTDAVGDKAKELAAQFPGDVYIADIVGEENGEPVRYPGVVHLPKSGGGGTWYAYVMGGLRDAKVSGASWDGQNFKGNLNMLGQGFTFSGSVDAATGKLTGELFNEPKPANDEAAAIEGHVVKKDRL